MGSKFQTLKRRLSSEVDTALTDLKKKLDGAFSDECWATGRCPAHDTQACVDEIVTGDKVLPGLLVGAMEYGPSTLLYRLVEEAAREWCDEQECCCLGDRVRAAIEDEKGEANMEFFKEAMS